LSNKSKSDLANPSASQNKGAEVTSSSEAKIESDGSKSGQATKEKSKENLLSSFENPNLSGGLALAGSETDSFIEDVMKDIEGKDSPSPLRNPASEKVSDMRDIGEQNGPSLFLRMRHVFERCLKRSCVAKQQSEKI
jgi:hypothetical protein